MSASQSTLMSGTVSSSDVRATSSGTGAKAGSGSVSFSVVVLSSFSDFSVSFFSCWVDSINQFRTQFTSITSLGS
jgi:hypothetical protein